MYREICGSLSAVARERLGGFIAAGVTLAQLGGQHRDFRKVQSWLASLLAAPKSDLTGVLSSLLAEPVDSPLSLPRLPASLSGLDCDNKHSLLQHCLVLGHNGPPVLSSPSCLLAALHSTLSPARAIPDRLALFIAANDAAGLATALEELPCRRNRGDLCRLLLLLNLRAAGDGGLMYTLLQHCQSDPATADQQQQQPTTDMAETCPDLLEELCRRIATRWDTMTKFAVRISTLGPEVEVSASQNIDALTAMGNTSNLQLITGLPDPTGLDPRIVVDLLERSSSFVGNDNVEEQLDLSVYFCALVLRKLWECLVISINPEIRRQLLSQLHCSQQQCPGPSKLLPLSSTFYVCLRSALLEHDIVKAQQVYREHVGDCRLQCLRDTINKVRPLALRLELLQNVYAMLFSTEHDLLAPGHHSGGLHQAWSHPETEGGTACRCSDVADPDWVATKLNKHKFVSSLYLCRDILVILEGALDIIKSQLRSEPEYIRADSELSHYMDYPEASDLERGLSELGAALYELRWRLRLLTTTSSSTPVPTSQREETAASLNFIGDQDPRFLLDIARPGSRKRGSRHRTSQVVLASRRSATTGMGTGPSTAATITTTAVTRTRYSRSSLEDAETILAGNDGFSAAGGQDGGTATMAGVVPIAGADKYNCGFLMDCMSWLVSPLEVLVVMALESGCSDIGMLGTIESRIDGRGPQSSEMGELLVELQYRTEMAHYAVRLVELLDRATHATSQLIVTAPEVTTTMELDSTTSVITKAATGNFGRFNWSKLSAVNARITGKTETQLEDISSRLLSKTRMERPTMSPIAAQFDTGLLLDLACNAGLPTLPSFEWSAVVSLLNGRLSGTSAGFTDESGLGDCVKLVGLGGALSALQSGPDNVLLHEGEKQQRWLEGLKALLNNDTVEKAEEQSQKEKLKKLLEYLNQCGRPFRFLHGDSLNYLASLISHLQTFAQFLERHQSLKPNRSESRPERESSVRQTQQQEFEILKRSPLEALGELIFCRGVDPSSQEMLQTSRELGLDVSAVVMENCLPPLPSRKSNDDSRKSQQHHMPKLSLFSERLIYNEVIQSSSQDLEPLLTASSLLQAAIELVLKYSDPGQPSHTANETNTRPTLASERNSDTGSGSPHIDLTDSRQRYQGKSTASVKSSQSGTSNKSINSSDQGRPSDVPYVLITEAKHAALLSLAQDESWQRLVTLGIPDLARVDLDNASFSSLAEYRGAFFVNLSNLMTLHMTVIAAQTGRTTLKFRSLEAKLARSNFCYRVGQLGAVSIDQIQEHFMGIPDVTFCDYDLIQSELQIAQLPTELEERYRVSNSLLSTLVIFGLIDGTISGCPLQVYGSENLARDLRSNVAALLFMETRVDQEQRQIHLPQMVKWYNGAIALYSKDRLSISRVPSTSFPGAVPQTISADEDLVRRLLSHCPQATLWHFCRQLRLDTNNFSFNMKEGSRCIKVVWLPRLEALGLQLGISTGSDDSRQLSTGPGLVLCEDTSCWSGTALTGGGGSTTISSSPYPARLRPVEFLRDTNGFLACLTYTVLGDDFPHRSDQPNHDDCLGEARSYKYSRLDGDYRALGGWLLRFWAPWASNMDSHQHHIYRHQRLCRGAPVVADSLLEFGGPGTAMEVRWSSVSHPQHPDVARSLLEHAIQQLRSHRNYVALGAALRAVPHQTAQGEGPGQHLLALRDICMLHSARFWASGLVLHYQSQCLAPPEDHMDQSSSGNDGMTVGPSMLPTRQQQLHLVDCLCAISRPHTRLTELHRYLELLDIDLALHLVELEHTRHAVAATEAGLDTKLLLMLRLFKRVHDVVLDCQQRQITEVWQRMCIPREYRIWPRLHATALHSPDRVLHFLVDQRQFSGLCHAWVRLFPPSPAPDMAHLLHMHGIEVTEAEYIVSLVTEPIGTGDGYKLGQVVTHLCRLERHRGKESVTRVVQHVVHQHGDSPLAVTLVCSYAVRTGLCSGDLQLDLQRAWVGASMVRAVRETQPGLTDHYNHLGRQPLRLLEQLLMNCQIDLFRRMLDVFREVKKSFLSVMKKNSDNIDQVVFVSELEPDSVNCLLTEYICKSLELSAFKDDDYTALASTAVASSTDDTISLYSTKAPITRTSSIASLLSRQHQSGSHPAFLTDSTGSNTTLPPENSRAPPMSSSSTAVSAFVMPPQPPLPIDWVKDRDATVCMCCSKEHFSMFSRRHHCRRCGRVVCSSCSGHRGHVPSDSGVAVRVCDNCHAAMVALVTKAAVSHHGARLRRRSRLVSMPGLPQSHISPAETTTMQLLSSDSDTTDNSGLSGGASFEDEQLMRRGERAGAELCDVGALESGWRLSKDDAENEMIRQMFYYDEAPSVTIAFSLADFHSNSNECGNLLLDRVAYLADFLKPMRDGLSNPEVDYMLVIDIAKRITYKAKLKFSRLNNDVDFARAEDYLSRLDLLGVLVRSRYSHCLPPFSEDAARFREKIVHLRDSLIREERLELARVVSTKAGLSVEPVVVCMALQALEQGQFEEARRLFGSVGGGSVAGVGVGSQTLNEIMRCLEADNRGADMILELVENLRSHDELLNFPEKKYVKKGQRGGGMDRRRMEEAIFYLGASKDRLPCLRFLSRHRLWPKALDLVMQRGATKKEFIRGVVEPAVTTGHFVEVRDEMLMMPGWKAAGHDKLYYEDVCRHLEQRSCYIDLLNLQQSNDDHARAAGTLIHHFFLRGAQSYSDLGKRLDYLNKAEYHFMELLKKKNTNEKDCKRKLCLIRQQIEATRFVSNPISQAHYDAGKSYLSKVTSGPGSSPPTLFGVSSGVLVDFCLTVLFCRPNTGDSLQLLGPLMAQCHLYPERILPRAATWLLENTPATSGSSSNDEVGCAEVLELGQQICLHYRLDSRKSDEVLLAIMSQLSPSLLTGKYQLGHKLLQMLKTDQKKIEAYVTVGDFKRAYSIAARLGYADEVSRIIGLAEKMDDESGVVELCKQWLANQSAGAF